MGQVVYTQNLPFEGACGGRYLNYMVLRHFLEHRSLGRRVIFRTLLTLDRRCPSRIPRLVFHRR